MKVAISAQGSLPESPVDPRFGRAKFFIVADTETGVYASHDNTMNLNAAQGAGIQAAKNVSDLGVGAVITGHVGPKAFAVLSNAGIEMYVGASGTVREAVGAFKSGTLNRLDRADVEGHWI